MIKLELPEHVKAEIEAGALFVVNHSAGKDSQAMTALLAEHVPANQVLVIHAELPGADWDNLGPHIMETIPNDWTVTTCRAQKTFIEMVERRFEKRPDAPSFPSPSTRQCTSDLKRDPIAKTVRHYLKANPQFNGRVVHCIGLRAQESSSRAKAPVWKENKRESKAGRNVFEWLPIHELTEDQVFKVIEEAGQKPHYAYSLGMSRLSCCFCIMANKRDLTIAAQQKPAMYAEYVELEKKVGYTMSMEQKPLEQVTGIKAGVQLNKAA